MTRRKTTAESSVALVPQPHGGALRSGGKPGNVGGTGRPPNELRERLRAFAGDHLHVLQEIAGGTPTRQHEVPLGLILRHARCPSCNGKLEALDKAKAPLVRFAVKVSAQPADRRGAIETGLRFGLGTRDEITMVSPDVQDRIRRTVQLIASRKSWHAQDLLDQLEEVWK